MALIVGVITFLVVFLLLFYPISTLLVALFGPYRWAQASSTPADFACIFTAYGNAALTAPGIAALLKTEGVSYHIYLVADAGGPLPDVTADRLSVLQPLPHLHSKVRSMRHALQHFVRPHSHVVIIDADNVPKPQFLNHLQQALQAGFAAVQGQRMAAHTPTTIADLDAVNELFYNHCTRYVPFRLGSSSTIAGSGMAIRTDLFGQWLDALKDREQPGKVIAAEDKLLQVYLAMRQHRIAYHRQAQLLDAKIEKPAQLQRQRTRWLNAWIRSLPRGLELLLTGLRRLSWNQFHFGISQLYPPLFLLLGSSLLTLGLQAIFLPSAMATTLLALLIFVLNFLLVLALNKAPSKYYRALASVPLFVSRQVLALIGFKKADKDFMATVHSNPAQTKQED